MATGPTSEQGLDPRKPPGFDVAPDLISATVELPCAALGFDPPDAVLAVRFMEQEDGLGLICTALSGFPPNFDAWLQGFGPEYTRVGRTGRVVRATLTLPDATWVPLLRATRNHYITLHPDGRAVAVLRGDRMEVQRFIESVRRGYPGAALRSLHATPGRRAGGITDRQREALEAAHAAGYYRVPRPVNLRTLARKLGISSPALSELLRRAEGAIIDAYVARPREPAVEASPPAGASARGKTE